MLLAGLLASRLAAGDPAGCGPGRTLSPLAVVPVRLRSLEIELDLSTEAESELLDWRDGRVAAATWQVEAVHRFENLSRERVTLPVGYPEHRCEPRSDLPDFTITVGGRPVSTRLGRRTVGAPWAPRVGEIHVFDIELAPREVVEVVQRYQLARSGSGAGTQELVRYRTRTGTGPSWAGTIGRARFTVRVPWRPWEVRFPEEYRVKEYLQELVAGSPRTRLIFEQEDWVPTEDFSLDMEFTSTSSSLGLAGSCGLDRHELGPRQAPILRQLCRLSAPELRACRHAVFAHHGRAFQSETLREAFYGQGTTPGQLGLRVDPGYRDEFLTRAERAYLREILAEERRRDRGVSPPPSRPSPPPLLPRRDEHRFATRPSIPAPPGSGGPTRTAYTLGLELLDAADRLAARILARPAARSHRPRRRMGRLRHQARLRFEEALRADPHLYQAWDMIGFLHFTTGQDGHAERAYDRALQLRPGDPVALEGKAKLHPQPAPSAPEAATDAGDGPCPEG